MTRFQLQVFSWTLLKQLHFYIFVLISHQLKSVKAVYVPEFSLPVT